MQVEKAEKAERAVPLRSRAAQPSPSTFETNARALALSDLSEHDRAAIDAVISGQSAWVSDADGSRAHVRYFAAALSLPRLALLIAPSQLTLLRERTRLTQARLPVAFLCPQQGKVSSTELAKLRHEGPLVVLVACEALGLPEVQRALEKANIGIVAIEEAHLLADNSHEFRPAYEALPALLEAWHHPAVHALTRCARPDVRHQAMERLSLTGPLLLEGDLLAPNVVIDTRLVRADRRQAALLGLINDLPGAGVVLCAAPHEVDMLYEALVSAGLPTCRAHAGMPAAQRSVELQRFDSTPDRAILITTSASAPDSGLLGILDTLESEGRIGFGQSACRRDLRFIVHYHAPASLEQYAKELALLGADGGGGTAVILYDPGQRSLNEAILEQQRFRGAQISALVKALQDLAARGKPVTIEALALQNGLSRRTTDRLLQLLSDARLVTRAGNVVELSAPIPELAASSERLAARLESLRSQDGQRLAQLERLATSNDCRQRTFARYFGNESQGRCGHCSACTANGGARSGDREYRSAQAAPSDVFATRAASNAAPGRNSRMRGWVPSRH